jgi:uncharacterized protein
VSTVSEVTQSLVGPSVRRHGVLVLAVVAAVSLGGLAAGCTTSASASTTGGTACSPDAPRLTVQGSGVATGTPDVLTVVVDISTTDSTAQSALSDNNGRSAAVIAAFVAGGVTKQNIQTTDLTVQPNYSLIDGTEELAGYGVNDTVTATVTNLAAAGTTIDSVSGAAGNAGQINSVSFSIKDPRDLQDQARTDAVHQAVSHARAMAASAGERLGPVCSLTDSTPEPQAVPSFNSSAGMAATPAVPLEVGEQQANAQVTMVYALEAGATAS